MFFLKYQYNSSLFMPNTLAHFGIQSLISKASQKKAAIQWIGLGCLLPDIPWIVQRLVLPFHRVDPVDLRLYVMIQASLFMCVILAAAISVLAQESKIVFFLLSGNAFLHLLLDATQIKWANGVHLLAPLSWNLFSLGWYWPEQMPTLLLTLAGLLLFPFFVWKEKKRSLTLFHTPKRMAASGGFLLLYLFLPCLLIHQPFQEDNHFTRTLRSTNRTGLYLEIDRKPYHADKHTIEVFTGEQLTVTGSNLPAKNCTLSVQGMFTDQSTILLTKYHVHNRFRNIASAVGIFLLIISWLVALLNKRISILNN
jgi:hypothetical protein